MKHCLIRSFVAVFFAVIWTHSASTPGFGQTAPVIGLHENTPNVVALQNAKIVVAPGRILEKATLLIRDGRVEAVGVNMSLPADAVTLDASGRTIYPGLIDLFSNYGMPQEKAQPAGRPGREPAGGDEKKVGAVYWNASVRAQLQASELFNPDAKTAEGIRKNGFTTVLTFPSEGIFRGTGAVVLLTDDKTNAAILNGAFGQALSFSKGATGGGRDEAAYPSSLMGSIALIRQTLLDTRWHTQAWTDFRAAPAGQTVPETNLALAALQEVAAGRQPALLEASDELEVLRAAKIAKEFNLDLWIRGSGAEYRRLDAVKNTGLKLIIPLNFPEAPDVSTREKELDVTLEQLRHWDFAPENPGRLAKANVPLALTAAGLKKMDDFLGNLRLAVKRGLPPETALAALTATPAAWLKMSAQLGSLEPGKIANLVITDGDLFADKTKILDTWVAGKRYEVTAVPQVEARGTWALTITTGAKVDTGSVTITGEATKPQATVQLRGKKTKAATTTLERRVLSLNFPSDSLGIKGMVRMSGLVEDKRISGQGFWSDGAGFSWSAIWNKPYAEKPDTTKPESVKMAEFPVVYPDGAFGRAAPPTQPEAIVVKNATVWTSGPQGVLENADLLVEKGKIVRVGKNLQAPSGTVVIDATGKHVTPGLIDAHSHIAISRGVNEGTFAISSEVRIGDVIDSDDISIYRQLAGGLTMSNLLHGSANPIGGQNAVIKLRWGALPDELKFDGAMPGIKFALGENVKQSNWGDQVVNRYPQTRMGVAEFIRDNFMAAKDYRRAWQQYNVLAKKNKYLIPPRQNLRLDALLDILDGKRQIHCHSYRQDEILALIRVGDETGFKVDVFTHILEGYKVADAMRKHGSMASTFSDWWMYKFEVYDAIPYNGALMYDQGLVVGFNSDDAELARRLNTEASKAIKYGGVPPVEALKFVTLNPARQLHVDNRVGSLEPGKDADFVIWSGDPLSTYSMCEQTWIDGRKYFDVVEDRALQEKVTKERAALVQKILSAGGEKKQAPPMGSRRMPRGYQCDDVYDAVGRN